MKVNVNKRDLLRSAAGAAVALGLGGLPVVAEAAGDPVRPITLYSRTQAANPQQFQAAELIAQIWSDLGLDVSVQALPNTQLSDTVWYNRDSWDTTMWQMVGRPERSDPDEFVYNLFHSSTAPSGYNFVGWENAEYDRIAEQQRLVVDPEERLALISQAQTLVNENQPYAFLVYPTKVFAFDKTVFDETSVVEQPGLGIKNFLSFVNIAPLGEQTDLIMNSSNELNAINPFYISGAQDSWMTELIWDRMMRIGEDGRPMPWAAETVEWNDTGTEVTMTLRDGMMWHDGEPVTTDDVIFSFTAPQGDMVAPMYKPFVEPITSIEATDDKTVVLTLAQPNAAFETSTLSKVNLVPEHVWGPLVEGLAEGETAEAVVEDTRIGSGPFKFDRWATQQEVVLTANADHWSAPKIDRLIMRIVLNVEAGLGMLRSGELNFMSDYTGDPALLLEAAEADDDLAVVESVDIGFQYAAFNARRAPFDDAAFRKALSTAINRQLLRNAAWNGFAEIANSHVSSALPYWHETSTDNMETGMDLARQMLTDAGYSIVDGVLHYPDGVTEQFAE
ncbi:ABC transporter substrate-binding protein [Pseudooceanicola aestuarii]|uniref:ABC transporter substrate-binding protein n=1 Tax=Pseudooceanicola aestuarii TaxID=2697319 RepID=UPI001EF954A0|nr:ABC transporter substrate-binding protein [Pseudooceanicola aestuarii]